MDSILILGLLLAVLLIWGGQMTTDGTFVSQGFNAIQTAITGNYSYQDLVNLATNAGFPDPYTAAAIAVAESSGDPNAYNPEKNAGAGPGMGSYGLWQIYRKDHPEFNGWDLLDPVQNAEAAFEVWAASGFNAWSTYKYGVYAKYVQQPSEVFG